MPATAGYSGTPLARKLGLKDGMRVSFTGMPGPVAERIAAAALELIPADPAAPADLVHWFGTDAGALARMLAQAMPRIAPDGAIWVSWPKKSSKVPTTITEDVIRAICLPMGLVDVKVCAVDDTWSGLKLVIRKALRGQTVKT